MICKLDHFWTRVFAGTALLAIGACSPPTPDLTPAARVHQALAAGDGLGAEIILRDQLASGTPQKDLAAYLGEAQLQQGKSSEAREWLGKGQFSADTRGHGFHMLGRLEMLEGDLPGAGRAFDRALESIPEEPGLWVDIGRLRYRGGEQMQAVQASNHAAALGPQNTQALLFHAQLLRDAEGMAAALPYFEAALEKNPDNLALLGDYAATLGEIGYAKDMLVIIRRMTQLDGSNSRALYLQAVLAARAGQFDLARNLLNRSGDFARDKPAAIMLSAIIDMEQGNFASASLAFDLLERKQPDNGRIELLLARSLWLGGNHRELVYRFADKALAMDAPPYLASLVGRSYEAMDMRDHAAQFLDFASRPRSSKLVSLDPMTPLNVAELRRPRTGDEAVALVRGLMIAGQKGAAINAAEAFRKRVPGSADALGLAADAYLFGGKAKRALDLYLQAAKIRQSWPLTRRMVAAQTALGDINGAVVMLENRLESDPANIQAAILLAQAAWSSGDAFGAKVYLDHAIANGAYRDPHAFAMRAQAALQLGELANARRDARMAYDLQPMSKEATLVLAQVLEQTGENEGDSLDLVKKAARLPTGT